MLESSCTVLLWSGLEVRSVQGGDCHCWSILCGHAGGRSKSPPSLGRRTFSTLVKCPLGQNFSPSSSLDMTPLIRTSEPQCRHWTSIPAITNFFLDGGDEATETSLEETHSDKRVLLPEVGVGVFITSAAQLDTVDTCSQRIPGTSRTSGPSLHKTRNTRRLE